MVNSVTPQNGPKGARVNAAQFRLIFAGLILSMVLASLDQSIVNTALPRMASELGGLAHLSWVVTAFMLASTIATPIFGKLSDMFGRRNFLLLAIGIFLLASVLCGFAQTMGQLIAFRLLQGIGAGGIMTLTQTVIGDVVSPRERVRYQGFFTGAFAFSAVAGPLIGGGLTTYVGWRWGFYVNLPIGLVAFVLIWSALTPRGIRQTHKIDFLGAALLSFGAAAALLLFSWGGTVFAWKSLEAVGLGALALALIGLFIWRERWAAEPIMTLSMFRIPRFTIGSITMGCMAFGMQSAIVFLPLYFQLVLGLSPAEAGFMLLPQILAMLITSIFGGRISADLGRPKLFMGTGIACEALGLSSLALLAHTGAPLPWFWGALTVLGLGMGIAMPNATAIIQNAVPEGELGVATASMSFVRSLGGALGLAVSGGVMATRLTSELASHPDLNVRAILEGGMSTLSTVPIAVRPEITEAFRHAITGSFQIGGAVMATAFCVAMLLRNTRFDGDSNTSSSTTEV